MNFIKSLFNFTIRNRDIASLITAFMLAFTTPNHLVAEAYQASQRALDWNHDISSIKAKLKEIEEEREEPRLVFEDEDEDGYESDTSYKLGSFKKRPEMSRSFYFLKIDVKCFVHYIMLLQFF